MEVMSIEPNKTFLNGVRVLEIADERGEYVGRVLAGLGADVVKIEPPAGEATRKYGPFLGDDSDAGLIAVTRDGQIVMPYNSEGMKRACGSSSTDIVVRTFAD